MTAMAVSATRGSKGSKTARVVRQVYGRDAWAHCADYKEELLNTVKALTTPGKGILAMDESNGTGGIPGIKVDTGLVPLVGGKEGESWCRGLDDLKERTVDYYKAGARFAKWRTTVRVRDHSALAVAEAAHGLARYAS